MPKNRALKASPKKPILVRYPNPFVDKTNLEYTIKKALNFLDTKVTKRIAIVSDNDQDGITSAVQMKLFLESKRISAMVFFYDHYAKRFNYPKSMFVDFNPERTIFLDLNEGFVSDILAEIGNHAGQCLIIDHHQSEPIKNNPFRCVVIKPHSFSEIEPSRYPTSKMVFDLFNGVDWLCAIGVIGDFAHEQWKDFVDAVVKRFRLSRSDLTELEEIVGCISSQYPEKITSLFGFLCSIKSPSKLLNSEFVAFKKLFDARLKILHDDFYKEAEKFEDSQLYLFRSDNRFSSKLSNIISDENPSKTIIIFEQPGEQIKCSIRRQDFKVNCGNLAKAGVLGIPDSKGGGHIPAAGASFPPQYFEQFKKQVRLFLLENPPNSTLSSKK